ncbi:hypothetical protein DMENIID0001_157670 [Sergentomyia squamirostris]
MDKSVISVLLLCFVQVITVYSQSCSIVGMEQEPLIILPTIPIGPPATLQTYNMANTNSIVNITNNAVSGRIFINADYNAVAQALTIYTTEEFPNYAQYESSVTILVTISFSCATSTRDITFSQPLLESNDHHPEFLQPIYEIRIPLPIPANFDLTLFQEIAARDIDIGQNQVTFSADSEYVTVGTSQRQDSKTYYATMTTKTQILTITHSIAFEITATDIGGLTAVVPVYIDSDGENIFLIRPVFEQVLYTGTLNEDLSLVMPPIFLDTDTYDEETVVFSLRGEDSDFFVISNNLNLITLTLREPLSEEDIEDKNFLQFQVIATRPGIEEGAAVVFIDLMKVCPEVTTMEPPTTLEPTTCPPPVECPTTVSTDEPGSTPEPTTAAPPPDPELCPDPEGPIFQDDFYTFRIFYGQMGVIGIVRASHPEHPSESIEYSLNIKDDVLVDQISVDEVNGEVRIVDQLMVGVYGFEVFATILVDDERKTGRALVTLIVESNEKCSPTPVDMSLMVRRLEENAEHDIMSSQIEQCQFQVLGFIPNDQDYFYIDNQRLKSINFDREADIFADMAIPQFQVSLKLECPENHRRKRSILSRLLNNQRDIDVKDYVYTNDIPHASTITVLNVIIEDVNDNKPEITYPTASDGFIFGYPEPSLADKLMLSHALQVVAIDRDVGVNALIKFGLYETNSHFTIDSTSGIIYPKRNALASSSVANLRVIATDRPEDEGTLNGGNVNIAIHRLSAENIAVVTVDDVSLENAEEVRESILNVDDGKILILHSTTIPGHQDSRNRQITDTVVMKFLVYGFSNERLLEIRQIEQRMNDVSEKYQARTSPLEDILLTPGEEEDITGYIVGLACLGAVVLALIIGAFWGWWKWIRPYEYKTMENESVVSDDNGLNSDFDKKAVIDGDIPEPIRLSETYNDPERQSPALYPNIESSSVETLEPRDEVRSESPPNNKERRKSFVTFNEDVERIEIVTEIPADTQSDSEKEVNYKF